VGNIRLPQLGIIGLPLTLVQLVARVGWQKACVAMANKNARILWAVMTRDEGFDARHVSEKPQAKRPANERIAAPTPNMTRCPA
jgi:hypothetical protein